MTGYNPGGVGQAGSLSTADRAIELLRELAIHALSAKDTIIMDLRSRIAILEADLEMRKDAR